MMKLLLLATLMISNLSFAQSQQIKAGGSGRLTCAPGTSAVTTSVNARTVEVYCETTCTIAVMTEYNLKRAQGINFSTTGTEYVVVAYLPDGSLVGLTAPHSDKELVFANVDRMADSVVQKGYCDKAIVN